MALFNAFGNILLFFIALTVFAISPGYVILSLCRINLSRLEKFVLSLGLGIVTSCCLYFFTGFLNIRIIADILIALFFIVFLFIIFRQGTFRLSIRTIFNKKNLISLIIPFLLIFICSFFQSSLVSGGGYNPQDGTIKFSQTGDAMWLISLSRELSKNIPPIHPGFAPEIVTNYHYFTHLFMGLVFRFTNISLLDLYYNYFSLFWCVFLGLSAFIFGRRFFKNNFFAGLLTLFTYTAGSFSYLLPIWLGKNFDWNDSNFWVSQTFNIILNPAVMLSLSLFYLTVFCFYKYLQEKDNNIFLPLILLGGSLVSFKIYAGIIVYIAFACILFYDFLKKQYVSLWIILGMLTLSALIFLPVAGKDSASFLVYAPFWFLHTMVENPDRLNISVWALKEQYFWATGNIFAVVRLRLVELSLFLTGNLGIRIVSFFILPMLLLKKIILSRFLTFLLLAFFTGMTIPLFFIQSGSVGNTIQFFYYSLITGNILTITVLNKFYANKKILIVCISFVLIFLSLPTTIKSFISKGKPVIMQKNQVASLYVLKNLTEERDVILLPPSPVNLSSMYVSVVSERNSFYSHKLMAENTLKNWEKREEELQQFFFPKNKKAGLEFQKKFLLKYNLNTLYLLNEELIYLKKIYIPYKVIFKNNSASIIRFL